MQNEPLRIETYTYLDYEDPAEVFHPYDARAPHVAARVAAALEALTPGARVDHIGSTAVPDCAGKGPIDLLLRYPAGGLEAARGSLDGLGFQRQVGRNPFPESRPMRVGAVTHGGSSYRLHVHVIADGDPEAAALLRFRDRLRADPALRDEYVAAKRAALASGPTDAIAYNRAKEPFILRVLGRRAATS